MDNSVKEDWSNAEVTATPVGLNDEAAGVQIIMRVFDFQLPPIKEEELPTKEQLLDFHKTKITAFLWRDELTPIKDMWSLVFAQDNKSFKIFVPCQAKAGSVILEKSELLSTYLNGLPKQGE